MSLHRRLLKNRKRKGDRAGFCENEVHKRPPLCKGSFHEPWGIPRSTPNIKGPLVQRGAFLLVRQLVHYTCGDSSLLYGGFYW